MATYNVSLTVGPAADEKIQRTFLRVNELRVSQSLPPFADVTEWFQDHLLNWGRSLWGDVSEHEADEVKTAYASLDDKDKENQVRALLRSLGVPIEDIP